VSGAKDQKGTEINFDQEEGTMVSDGPCEGNEMMKVDKFQDQVGCTTETLIRRGPGKKEGIIRQSKIALQWKKEKEFREGSWWSSDLQWGQGQKWLSRDTQRFSAFS